MTFSSSAGGAYVHSGFNEKMSSVWNELSGYIVGLHGRFPRARIAFAGHSLGGALAQLAAARFETLRKSSSSSLPELTGVYTFGGPRVGSSGDASDQAWEARYR